MGMHIVGLNIGIKCMHATSYFIADDSIFAIVLLAILLIIGAAISVFYIVCQDNLYLKFKPGDSTWQKW